jgi:hypothetical protein
MEIKPKNLGRAYLVGKLQAQGLSRRRSVLVVNVILERMIRALKRGWEVDFPLGKLKRVKAALQQALARHRRPAGESGSTHDRARTGLGWRSGVAPLGLAGDHFCKHAISTFDEFQLPCSEIEFGIESLVVSQVRSPVR